MNADNTNNDPPVQPGNTTPTNGQNDVYDPTPTLIATGYSDLNGDSHLASQWQISTDDVNFDENII